MLHELLLWVRENLSCTPYLVGDEVLIHVLPIGSVILYYLMLVFLPKLLGAKKECCKECTECEKTGTDQEATDATDAAASDVASPEKSPQKPKEEEKEAQKRPPLTLLNYVMFAHNLFLSVLSSLCFLVVVPMFLHEHVLKRGGWLASVCDPERTIVETESPIHFAGIIFTWLKYYELLDTVFLIVRKPERPVPFLHWYHHITVLLYTWYAFYFGLSAGYLFGTINLLVHSLMYAYYAFMCLHIKLPGAILLTALQIAQMMAGITILCFWAYYHYFAVEGGCGVSKNPDVFFIYGVCMYGSYLFLFVKFFIGRYCGGKKNKVPEKEN